MIDYIYKPDTVHMDKDVQTALVECVKAVRDVHVTRAGEDERRLTAAGEKLLAAVAAYALASIPSKQSEYCTHPNAYHLYGAHMFCPRCGEFNAMEE